jgi:hypothetical protein
VLLSRQEYNLNPENPMERPFVTAYRLAILFAQEHHDTFEALGMDIGG